jgi:RNA polymerase sigma-70 factor (ECF subfamily)
VSAVLSNDDGSIARPRSGPGGRASRNGKIKRYDDFLQWRPDQSQDLARFFWGRISNSPPWRCVVMIKGTGTGAADERAQLSDEALLSRYRDLGRTEDFETLIRRYQNELYRYLTRYLGDRTLSEDVFQNTFLQIHLKRGLYEEGRPVRPWIYSIATHQAVDALRKVGRHPTLSLDQSVNSSGEAEAGRLIDLLTSSDGGPLAELELEERKVWVRQSVARLPDVLRQTLMLAYHEDLKYREIAEILKIPVGTVKSRLHAALAKLQQMARAVNRDGNR